MTAGPVLIVGSRSDPHVQAVVERLNRPPVVFDADELGQAEFAIRPESIELNTSTGGFATAKTWRGWLRRLAPPDWELGVEIGSHDAAVKASWLAVVAAIARHPGGTWLTDLDSLTSAEGKLHQYSIASRQGIQSPATIVTNRPDSARSMGDDLIAKPIGPSHFRDADGDWRSVFTEPFDAVSPADQALLRSAPFLIQHRVEATAHLRIVTVGSRAWAFELDASGMPMDWREDARGHREWRAAAYDGQRTAAIQLALAMSVGYSSQDWIVCADGSCVFVDLNPSGQWLFLPSPESDQVSDALAAWLQGPSS